MAKDIRMMVELNEGKHLRVHGQYAEYDSAAGVIKGFGEVTCPKHKRMDFEPTFQAVLYDKRNRICDTTEVTYDGVFSKTGKMVFKFRFDDVTEFKARYVKLVLIAKRTEMVMF